MWLDAHISNTHAIGVQTRSEMTMKDVKLEPPKPNPKNGMVTD